MYRLGEREHHHHKLYIFLAIFLVIVAGIIYGAKQFLTADTQITSSGAKISNVSYEQTKLQRVDTPYFSMDIPASWKLSAMNAEVPKPTYIWQGTVSEEKSRWISVYVDVPLPTFAVNRALHTQANGQSMTVIGNVSDNCTSFTGAANTQTGKTPAKWETIDFLCDSGNYQRNVTGSVSPDGLNTMRLTGTAKGTHQYFFTYTDNTNQPDYNIFTEALRSLKVK